ncbi:hypothetical protein COU61_04015 [Candidatus Pacearchaeota archaeon CG10_big_fil_rev_8_21_14_0_10_35_13]|nr:MAG: hypothetical protein COU61_04015 [Candidatus Pacearchaeota archaeon CG10_big_fil_rev_8_21_14_0_10_35_13]
MTVTPSDNNYYSPVSRAESFTKGDFYSVLSPLEAVAVVSDVNQARDYRDRHLSYDYNQRFTPTRDGRINPFVKTHKSGVGVCGEFAVAFASLLKDDGYPSLVMGLIEDGLPERGGSYNYHWVFVYQENGLWGSLGTGSSDTFSAIFSSQEILARMIRRRCSENSEDGSFTNWGVFSLDDYSINFISPDSPKDLRAFVKVLPPMPNSFD